MQHTTHAPALYRDFYFGRLRLSQSEKYEDFSCPQARNVVNYTLPGALHNATPSSLPSMCGISGSQGVTWKVVGGGLRQTLKTVWFILNSVVHLKHRAVHTRGVLPENTGASFLMSFRGYSRGPFLVKTRERRGSSFSQLGLEPNHTGLTAQSLFFLEESCRVKRSDTQTSSNFSNYFKRVLKLQKRSSSFSK